MCFDSTKPYVQNQRLKQAKDQWGNSLLGPYFNVTTQLYVSTTTATTDSEYSTTDGRMAERGATNFAGTGVIDYSVPVVESSSVTFLGNGSGIAMVTYVPIKSGPSSLFGELA